MPQPTNQQIVARQVERIVRRLTSLSTLPSVAAGLLNQMNEEAFDPVALTETIQADPALASQVLLLANREGIAFTAGPSVAEAVAKLPLLLLREAVISVKVFQLTDPKEDIDEKRPLPRRQMAVHSLAVACCADELARRVLPAREQSTAWLAGLLHDIGKCALDEVMPKSFARMVEQAQHERSGLMDVERVHLGLDHSVLGRRLAQKWNLPEPIVSAVWLHHCDAQALAADLPHAQLARVVALADRLVRRWELGQSGSYDTPDSIDELTQLLRLDPAQLEEIAQLVAEKVHEKSSRLGLTSPDGTAEYYSVIRRTAADLVRDNRSLSRCQTSEQRCTRQAALVEEFLTEVSENASPAELAQSFAAAWRKAYQTGLTCVYVVAEPTEPWVEMVAFDRKGSLDVKSLRVTEGLLPISESLGRCAGPVAADDDVRRIVQELGIDYDANALMMAPLKMGDKIVAVLVYEQLAPQSSESVDVSMLPCRIAASAVAMALAVQKQYELSERFVEVMNSLRRTRTELAKTQSLAGLAEMAAGAAHELNNPLAVISGRVQLLLASEEDETKKQMLLQIQGRTAEISEIISDLMSFARPKEPEKRSITLAELLNKAAELVKKTNGLNALEAELSGDGLLDTVYVDISQVTQSIAYVVTNALQSYKGDNGPIWVECRSAKETVDVVIGDKGSGMDAETLAKATEPFFSFKPAGRRRGMGLANAQRLLRLNGGSLKLDSIPGQGTTVTVTLPKI